MYYKNILTAVERSHVPLSVLFKSSSSSVAFERESCTLEVALEGCLRVDGPSALFFPASVFAPFLTFDVFAFAKIDKS